jgi:hypothetical protein
MPSCPGQGTAVAATPPLPRSYPDFRGGRPYIHGMATNKGPVTVETLTMRQISDLKKVATGKLRADCERAESSRDTLRIWPCLQRICDAINSKIKDAL